MIDDSVNEAQRDNPGTGCAFSALAPKIARSDQRTRAFTSEQVRNDIQLIAALPPARDMRTAKSIAILTFSALVGATALARAVSHEALSRDILNTVAELLKDSA
jgi:TetR/AcrR family transcriptional regulator, transcriptional repressor for nem operon